MKYKCIENKSTIDGKFGGYTITPETSESKTIPRLYRLDIPLKYDMNKELDKVRSNNGLS